MPIVVMQPCPQARKPPSGLAKSAANSQGPIARFLVLSSEDNERFEKFEQCYTGQYDPVNAVEQSLVTEIIGSRWRMERLTDLEACLIRNEIKQLAAEIGQEDQDSLYCAALEELIENSKTWSTIHRYRRDARRCNKKAEAELARLRAAAPAGAENEDVKIQVSPPGFIEANLNAPIPPPAREYTNHD